MSKSANSGSLLGKLALAAGSILLTIGLLAVLELVLSMAGVGPPKKLFIKKRVGDEEIYELNRRISELFFPDWATKPPAYEFFPAQKAPGTIRIFATGASSTVGDPFGNQCAFPALLGEILSDCAPEHDYEVVNCGVVAISSLDVLMLHKEALNYDPDAILIYCGHNEAYGADGVDTPVQRSFSSRTAAKAWLWFRNLRFVRLLRSLIAPKPPKDASEGFGMWTMKDRLVPACSRKHERMLESYRENILEMLETARRKGVDIILCSLLANLRDQSPMGSVHGCGFDPSKESEWQGAFDRAKVAMEHREWEVAKLALEECIGLDPGYAEAHFRLGRCLDALGDSSHAFEEYRMARDLDAVHFRACSAENEVLRSIARGWDGQGKHHLVFVDLDSLLHEEFPFGPGRRFFTEHVHPYPDGHAWIARKIAEGIAASPLGQRFGTWRLNAIAPDSAYLARVGMNALDVASGLVLTDRFKLAKWPFTGCYENAAMRSYIQGQLRQLETLMSPFERELYPALLRAETSEIFDFGKRHYTLFTKYRARRMGAEALREIRIASRYWWPAAFLETDQAQVLVGLGRLSEAEEHLERARALDPDYAPIHFVAGALFHKRGDLLRAEKEFKAYLDREPSGPYAAACQQALSIIGRERRGY